MKTKDGTQLKAQPDYHAMSDDDLLLAMAAGGNNGHSAFEAFSVRYIQPLNRLTYRLGFKSADCEDMLQDIWFIFGKRRRFGISRKIYPRGHGFTAWRRIYV